MTNDDHATNIGRIVLALADHTTGDYGDCGINDPILNIIDARRPAHELVSALADMSHETAAAIVRQLAAA
jgi:hypothetical protein